MNVFTKSLSLTRAEIKFKTASSQGKLQFGMRLLTFIFIGIFILGPGVVNSQVLTEDFNYTAGTAATANGWTAYSGAGTNPILVTSPGFTYTGHTGSGIGNAVTMTTSGEDINRGFTGITTGSVYGSMLVNVTAATATGDYFAGLLTNTTTFPVRIYIKSTTGGYFFGISKVNGAISYETTVRTFNTVYFVVCNYVYNTGSTTDDVVNLWINPALGGAETAATIPAVSGATDIATITAFFLRQGTATTASTQRVDAIRAGATWSSVTALSAPPVVTAASPSGTVGTVFNYNIVATNNPGSYAISSGTLPAGLTLNPTSGLISGTPTTAGGPISVEVTATNGSGTSAPATLSFTIAMGNQTITGLPATDSKTYGDIPYSLSATASSGLTVSYSSSNTGVATISGNQVTIVGGGSTTITASQAGNSDWNAATPVQQALTVNKASQTITFGLLGDKDDVDPDFPLTATSTSGLTVSYASSNTSVIVISGSTAQIVGAGSSTITASQAGDANYLPATDVLQVQNINNTSLQNQTITFNPLSNKIYGDAPFQLTASASSGLTVSYISSNTAVATVSGDMVTIVGPGTTTITASQAGNGSYNAAPPVNQNFTVDTKALTVTGSVADDKVYNGSTAATISGSTLQGIVGTDIVNINSVAGTFADPNVNTSIPVTAALTLGGADAAKYTLVQPTGLSANITKANQLITFGPLSPKSPGDANFNLGATSNSGLPISYTSSSPSVATVTTAGLVHIVALGATTMTASQSGGQNYFAATSVQQTQDVVAPTPVSIFSNPITGTNPNLANPYTAGQVVNVNITVSGIGRGSGITGTNANDRYTASGWNSVAFDANDYFEFTLIPNSGYRIDFSSFNYTAQASATGPTTFALRSSVDGYSSNIGTPNSTGTTILLSAGAYQLVTASTTFRLYGWGGSAAGGTFSVNSFTFNGNVFVALPTATFTKTNVSVCGGTNDGTITVTPGGTGPFTYSWTGETGSNHTPFTAGNTATLTGLAIGYYNVTVTDGNTNTVTITGIHIEYAFSVFITNSGSVSSSCGNTGSIILYGNAGVQPYTYALDGGTYQAGNTFTGLAAGPHTGYVKDAAGCVSSKSITVGSAPAIVVSPFARAASSCGNDGSIEVYRTGGIPPYTYSKDGTTYQASNLFSGLAAGPYTVYVKDSKGCIGSQGTSVAQGASLNVTAIKTNTSSCINDGTIQLNASGGTAPYTYSLDNVTFSSSNSFTGLSANNYIGYVKDFKGCIGSVNVTINSTSITVTAYSSPASNCASTNGVIQLFRSGGAGPYTYSLDGNVYQSSNLFTGLAPGFYNGFVKDSKTCIGQIVDIFIGPSCERLATRSSGKAPGKESPSLTIQAFPNPTTNEFTLNLSGYGTSKLSIRVTDIMGRIMYMAEGNAKQQYRFGNNFKAGIYNVQVIEAGSKKSITIVKD
ncbi:MAG: YDG domain-containing protein [Ferruginibacter sp.]